MTDLERELLLLLAEMLNNRPVGPLGYSDEDRLSELIIAVSGKRCEAGSGAVRGCPAGFNGPRGQER